MVRDLTKSTGFGWDLRCFAISINIDLNTFVVGPRPKLGTVLNMAVFYARTNHLGDGSLFSHVLQAPYVLRGSRFFCLVQGLPL